MAFTADELANIANAAIDYHFKKGQVFSNTIQNKPLLRKMQEKQGTFPGGKDNITVRAKGEYTTDIMGYTHDDTVTYGNPANIKEAIYPWKEIHAGISITMTELKKDGITVVDSSNGKDTVKHTHREMTALANLLEDKLEDLSEGTARGMNGMFWNDGTQDAKQVPGVRSIILDDPTAIGTVAGIDQVADAWWRNRAQLLVDVSTPSNQNLVTVLQSEFRQLRRYGGNPDTFLAGSDFIEGLERELRSNGSYTDTGFINKGKTDLGMADLSFKNVPIEYDPTLDDDGLAKYGYVLDCKTIKPMVMEGEDMKQHNPSRPENQYVFY
ncbi:MAG: phage major capsid protein, partial [Sneathiella sp.]